MHRNSASGPDIDEILRDLTRRYMTAANRSPADLANNVGLSPNEFRKWLNGKPGTIKMLSGFVASAGLQTVDGLLSAHQDYENSTAPVATMQDMLLARFGHLATLEEVRLALEMKLLVASMPESAHCIKRGVSDALDYAEHYGVDVVSERRMLERALRPMVQEDIEQTG